MTPKTVAKLIKTINVVAAYQLRDYQVAISIYEEFIKSHPNHALNSYLQKNIDNIICHYQ